MEPKMGAVMVVEKDDEDDDDDEENDARNLVMNFPYFNPELLWS